MSTPSTIVTVKDQESLIVACTKLKEELYLTRTVSEKELSVYISKHIPYTFIETVTVDLQAVTRDDLIQNIDLLLKELIALPQAEVVLAIEPKLSLVHRIQQIASLLLGRHCVIKISMNPQLIGGMQLYCNSKIYDFSVAKTLETISLQTTQ